MPREAERSRISTAERPLTSGKGNSVGGGAHGVGGGAGGVGGGSSSGTPSESGESHEIKFTKQEGCSLCTCACIFLAIAFVTLGSAAGIYFGLQLLSQSRTTDRVFKGKLVVLEGDQFTEELADSATKQFLDKSESYRLKLDALFNNSIYKDAFRHSEILALDNGEAGGKRLTVHFNLHLHPERGSGVDAGDLYFVLSEEVMKGPQRTGGVFKGLKIDHHTLLIQERKLTQDNPGDPWSPRRHYPGSLVGLTTPPSPDAPRKCTPLILDFCRSLPYNSTSYPNAVGHLNPQEVEREVISYRQVIDFECYVLAQEFICNALQPKCRDDKMVPPCRSFCQDFQKACSKLLPKEVEDKLNCSSLPKPSGNETCVPKPGCADELRFRGKAHLLCDGVLDCPDFSDETDCEFCKPGQFHCGNKQCVDPDKKCNNRKDCENGADESGCLFLSNGSNSTSNGSLQTELSQPSFYVSEGFVTWRDRKGWRRICLENQNGSLSLPRRELMLRHLATSTCTQLHYRSAEMVETRLDPGTSSLYSKMTEPLAFPVTFTPAQCSRHQAVYLKCSGLECGKRPSSSQGSTSSRTPSMSSRTPRPDQWTEHGDWPWYAALYFNGRHECQATLLADRWLLAPSRCFERGHYSNWTSWLGRVRLSSSSPFDQERSVGRVLKSPESKSHFALLRLQNPANLSDIVRPACVPQLRGRPLAPGTLCYTFAWAKSWLQQVPIRIRETDDCVLQNNGSFTSGSVDCAASLDHSLQDCQEEGLFPMPLMCQVEHKWTLVGVAAGSGVACKDLQYPHLYHRLDPHAHWVTHIIAGDT